MKQFLFQYMTNKDEVKLTVVRGVNLSYAKDSFKLWFKNEDILFFDVYELGDAVIIREDF